VSAGAGVACPLCEVAATPFLESPRWLLLRHADPVPIAGWMMLVTRAHREGPHALERDEQAELGSLVAAIAGAVRTATGCERAYLFSFNEAVPHMHLHVVPRHAGDPTTASWALADRYRDTAAARTAAVDPAVADETAHAVARHAERALAPFGFAPL
jgi:diadenosine tetraphosphate (Ap4A) HIT family hydrolase